MSANREQPRQARSTSEQREDEAVDAAGASERRARLDAEVDDLLDEIDDVLEENAEEFVSSFVQKGGE